MLEEIRKELEHLQKIKSQIEEIVKYAPEGKLRCAINKGCYQYYSGKTYLGEKKKTEIKKLAQKEYCQKLNRKVEKRIKKLIELQDIYENEELEQEYRRLHPARKHLIEPLVKPIENIIEDFENIEYTGKIFAEDDKTEYYTAKGERVRSKSEKIIADELYRYNIPYKYEMPIQLRVGNRLIQFYPDFTAINKRTGKRWVIEHFGMMDKMSYYENALQKLDIYEKNNMLVGVDLIILHETSAIPLNINSLRKYIERYLC